MADFCHRYRYTERQIYSAMKRKVLAYPTHTATGEVLIGVPWPQPPAPFVPRPEPFRGVYFIVCGDFIKIGLAEDVRKRFHSIRQSIPFNVTPIGWIFVHTSEETIKLERAWHARFAEYRCRGEWFTDNVALREAIAQEAQEWPAKK